MQNAETLEGLRIVCTCAFLHFMNAQQCELHDIADPNEATSLVERPAAFGRPEDNTIDALPIRPVERGLEQLAAGSAPGVRNHIQVRQVSVAIALTDRVRQLRQQLQPDLADDAWIVFREPALPDAARLEFPLHPLRAPFDERRLIFDSRRAPRSKVPAQQGEGCRIRGSGATDRDHRRRSFRKPAAAATTASLHSWPPSNA